MSDAGLSMMLITEGLVTLVTMYFFFKILFSKKSEKKETNLQDDE